jgi:hypothetical protein
MGKTWVIKRIIMRKLDYNPDLIVYHIDTKKKGDFTERDGRMIRSEFAPLASHKPGDRIVWQPFYDDIDEYDLFFTRILNAGMPAIVNIDESINMKFGMRIPRGLSILLAQGRLPGIHVIGGTQEVAKAPRQLLSQASYIICFSLFNEYDERAMLRYLRLEGSKHLNLRAHQCMLFRPDEDASAIFLPDSKEVLEYIT